MIVWVADTAIWRKPLDENRILYTVVDAVTGAPLPGAQVQFFGWRQEHKGDRKFEMQTQQFTRRTDGRGQGDPA